MNVFKRWKLKKLKKKAAVLAKNRQAEVNSDADLKKEIALHFAIAEMYDKYRYDEQLPNAELLAIESYRVAAALEDAQARYIIGQRLLERGKFWDKMKNSIYACNAHDKYAKDNYEEAFVYIKAAEQQGHARAKRLRGLAYVYGWGVKKDSDIGFKLVIASIDQENAWDKATKIFEETGLNKPEFFNSIMSLRASQHNPNA